MQRALIVMVLMAEASLLQAQEPFSTLELHVLATSNLNRNLLHNYWHPGRGGAISLATPFYWGIMDVGATVHRYNASENVPGFGAVWVYAGWSAELQLPGPLSLRPGVRLGNYHMSFDDAEITFSGTSAESDLVLSSGLALNASINRTWMIFTRADYLRVHTAPLLRLWYMSVGLAVHLPAGRRWRTLLE